MLAPAAFAMMINHRVARAIVEHEARIARMRCVFVMTEEEAGQWLLLLAHLARPLVTITADDLADRFERLLTEGASPIAAVAEIVATIIPPPRNRRP